ncbi:MAG: molybdopterin-dependent oxidoreductase [Candidatus Aminicenantes bacterium]
MKIIIDGREIETEENKTILEAARKNGIDIPSLCDHSRLAPFTGCRLCIVEVKGRKGFPPSCSTYVEEGMEIKTQTPRLKRLRREIFELILSEHPHACLICSEKENCDEYKSTIRKVGEVTGCVLCSNNHRCELQDVAEQIGLKRVKFPALYRDFDVKKDDPFFDRNYNLCILCGRCVRVCDEVRGAAAVSFIYRGSRAVVGTALDRPLLESGCQFCGACVDVCPTGALEERFLKYETLPDEEKETTCALCSQGCTLRIDLKKGKVLRSQPVDEGAVNRGQACVKGRFLNRDVVYSPQRILKPLIRRKKELEEVEWEEALDYVAQRLKKYKGKEIAVVTSPQLSCEDSYVFYRFARDTLKTKNVEDSSSYSPFALFEELAQENALPLQLNYRIEDIARAKTIFVLGEDLVISHPIMWLEVLEALKNGAHLMAASPVELSLNRFCSFFLRHQPGREFYVLAYLSKFILEKEEVEDFSQVQGMDGFKEFLDSLNSSRVYKMTGLKEEELRRAAEFFAHGEAVVLFGTRLTHSSSALQNLAALWNLALLRDAKIFPLALENNLRGIFEIGRRFSGAGSSFSEIIPAASSRDIKALYVGGAFPYPRKRKPEFLVVQDSYNSANLDMADAVFPATTFLEEEGITVNAEGRVQKWKKVIEPVGEAKPDWWIISQLAGKMGKARFDYNKPSQIMKEIQQTIPGFAKAVYSNLEKGKKIFIKEERGGEKKFVSPRVFPKAARATRKFPYLLLLDYNLDYYRGLVFSEDNKGMRKIRDSRWIKLSPEDAERLRLKEGETLVVESSRGKAAGEAKISSSLPPGIVQTSFLAAQSSDFSMASLLWASSPRSHFSGFLGPIPVRIKREE